MAKTLLEITQEILGEIGGDDVSSITDTEESEQVAKHVIAVYDNIVARENWPTHRRILQLVAVGDSSKPTYMTLPTNVKEVMTISYDKAKVTDTRKKYDEVYWKETDDFLRHVAQRNNTASNVDTIVDDSGVEIFVRNDIAPSFYTSFDDNTLVFDSYDSAVDATLQASKSQLIAYILPTLSLADGSVHDLPLDAERLLIEEAIARVQWKEKEMQDINAERNAVKQGRTISRKAWRTNKPTRYPDYGRRTRRTYEPTFTQRNK